MSNTGVITVHKGRRNVLPVSLGFDVSTDTLTSEVRSEPDQNSPLIMTWTITKVGGGTTGELLLTVDDLVTSQIVASSGYMDIKRVLAGEPYAIFDQPIEVFFQGSVTV